MEFSEVVRRRRMIRHYSDKPLAPEVIERILALALRAPSAGFSQGWAFLALTDPAAPASGRSSPPGLRTLRRCRTPRWS
ncbi:nitroreductase family protein [Streptomyces sp. NBC_00343]|uniref:nitroreductase family protein n=1 Tax=Streptomyces sp. NBC_00343 TaxID=2975719 RepID=UPI002E28F68C|nr:nitroreductase family protein [Streptomyces sp. NBC_00343]